MCRWVGECGVVGECGEFGDGGAGVKGMGVWVCGCGCVAEWMCVYLRQANKLPHGRRSCRGSPILRLPTGWWPWW